MAADFDFVLDTHVWLWMMQGEDDRIPAGTIRTLERAAERRPLGIAAISVWEVAMLESKGRLGLKVPVRQWIHDALGLPGLALIPMTPTIAIESCFLPGELHGDPADRMIVATARATGASLVTRDERLVAYGRAGGVRIHPI